MADYNAQTPSRAGIELASNEHAIGIADTFDNTYPGSMVFVHLSGDDPIGPVDLTISANDREVLSTVVSTPPGDGPGRFFFVGPQERPSGRYTIETTFYEVISGLSDFVDGSAAALTTAMPGEYATYDNANTRWQFGGMLADIPDVSLAPGMVWTVGDEFPDAPGDNHIHLFGAAVASGLEDYVDSSDTALTSAAAGDYATYDLANAQWVMLGNLSGVTATLTVGTSFPTGPSDGDAHVFSPKTNVPTITVNAIEYVRNIATPAGSVRR